MRKRKRNEVEGDGTWSTPLVGVEAMALSFIKSLALVYEGLELNFGTELSHRTESESELHTAISFVMYFFIFDCLAAEKTMGETFGFGLVFLFNKLLELNSCEF